MSTTTSDSRFALETSASWLAPELPDKPVAKIEPGTSWRLLDLREIWEHRELLYFLTWRDLKVRYKQTLFGMAWIVMQPLLMTVIFTIFLGRLAHVPTGGLPYSLLAYSGLVAWMFISNGVGGCSGSLVANANLITKVYFPRIIVPAAVIGTRLVDLAISFFILVGLILVYRFGLNYHPELTWSLAALPLVLILMTVFTFSLGVLLSALNVKYRDIGMALPVLIQLWMFISPVVYSINIVPGRWRILYSLNPVAGIIEGFRSALLGTEMNKFALGISVIVTTALFFCSALVFRRTEKSFADVI